MTADKNSENPQTSSSPNLSKTRPPNQQSKFWRARTVCKEKLNISPEIQKSDWHRLSFPQNS
ncbi:MAG: hypothetical protein LH472_10995 [Pyrinomonadaceae bacterium]|nr:hypothetical protein [Pyrinomonadaceae bacterium]